MKRLQTILKVLILTLMCSSTLSWASKTTPPLSFLFVQSADSAVLAPVKEHPGQFTLTLKKVNPYVTYFSDRPNRVTGMMPTAEFMAIWQKKGKDSFAHDAPNVNIEGMKLHYIIKNKSVSFVAELLNPQVDAKTHDITYDIQVLGAHQDLVPHKSVTLHQVVLFLDNWCPSCCCG